MSFMLGGSVRICFWMCSQFNCVCCRFLILRSAVCLSVLVSRQWGTRWRARMHSIESTIDKSNIGKLGATNVKNCSLWDRWKGKHQLEECICTLNIWQRIDVGCIKNSQNSAVKESSPFRKWAKDVNRHSRQHMSKWKDVPCCKTLGKCMFKPH